MRKERIIYLDILRVMACCMIVLMHSPHPNAGNSGHVVVPICFLTAAGLCLFFMVSGALLLPVQTSVFEFLKKRVSKIVFPTLFWTLFYLAVSLFIDKVSLSEIGQSFVSIPFSKQGHGILWFMYTLIGLYLLSPILSGFLKRATRQEVKFYLILWTITLLYPWLKEWVVIDESPHGVLYYFTGFVGYYVLGYYLHTYKPKVHLLVSLLLIFVPMIGLVAYELMGHEGWQSSGRFWYLSVFVAMMCVGWFSLAQRKNNCVPMKESAQITNCHRGSDYGMLKLMSNCCFGIYLIHIFVMRYVLWKVDLIVFGFGGIGQILCTWLLTLLISFAITYAISLFPYSEYIVGFRTKRK